MATNPETRPEPNDRSIIIDRLARAHADACRTGDEHMRRILVSRICHHIQAEAMDRREREILGRNEQ